MSGHSKWANIKQRKGAQDKKRGKLFSKVVKDIMVAAKLGGPDPDANPRLRLAIQKAKSVSLPRDNLDRAIKKGAGQLDGEEYEEIMYEGYGPAGVGVLVECLTDNRNRSASEVRYVFSKRGMSLASSGAAAHAYSRLGQVLVVAEGTDEDTVMMSAMEYGADDIRDEVTDDGTEVFQVLCEIPDLEGLREGLEKDGLEIDSYGLTWIPSMMMPVTGSDVGKLFALIEALEDLDDVQTVYANYDVSDEEMEQLQ